jgi:hypothetical protein
MTRHALQSTRCARALLPTIRSAQNSSFGERMPVRQRADAQCEQCFHAAAWPLPDESGRLDARQRSVDWYPPTSTRARAPRAHTKRVTADPPRQNRDA